MQSRVIDKFRFIQNKRAIAVILASSLSLAVLTAVGAYEQLPNFFQTNLFPPGFTARISPSSIGRNTSSRMKLPTDANPMRRYAAKIAASAGGSTLSSLGQQLFNDTSLSYPKGQACVSCHSPTVAFTFPSSAINLAMGPVPGAVHGRFGNRLVPSVTYAKFSPPGPFFDPDVQTYVGGQFWDGRATDETAQAQFPEFNPNEMNNIVDNQHPSQALLVDKLAHSPEAGAFKSVFGQHAFQDPPQVNLQRIGQAIAAFEASNQVSPFTSKYDAYLRGQATLTASEMNGLVLFTGSVTGRPGGPPAYKNAKCNDCHGIPEDSSSGPDVFSNFCYTNIGVPKNPGNPFYAQTDKHSNPLGYNPQGLAFLDLGLGDFLYPSYGLPPGNQGKGSNGQGDFLAINGTFKAPSLRNIDKRPSPGFVRAYMHNGNFKSLQDVVHFYNTRNLTTYPGEVIDFTKPNPYAGLKGTPLQRPPEYPSVITLNNPQGLPPDQDGEVGNLGLTPQEEQDIVAFLKTLSDGYQ